MLDLTEFRQNYTKSSLDEHTLQASAFDQFQLWMTDAIAYGILEPNAMTLSTVNRQTLMPSSRTVLLKEVQAQGFVFFTNYTSRKAQELSDNPQASLLFTWLALERQIHIQGSITKLSAQASEEYFHSRPRASQIGAWASAQSSFIENREVLEKAYERIDLQYPTDIPYPSHWGGYCLQPTRIEFWQGRSSRLHDRILYTQTSENNWKIERLSP